MRYFMQLMVIFGTLFPLALWGKEIRVYCKPDEVIIERRADGNPFTDENKLYDLPAFVIEAGEIPSYRFREQLQCDGTKLVVDERVKTAGMLKAEIIAKIEKEYVAELDSEKPDVGSLLRLQHDIQKLKKGDPEILAKYGISSQPEEF